MKMRTDENETREEKQIGKTSGTYSSCGKKFASMLFSKNVLSINKIKISSTHLKDLEPGLRSHTIY